MFAIHAGSVPGSTCKELSHNAIIAVVTSMTVFILLFFVFGFICGCFCLKCKLSTYHKASDRATHAQLSQPTPSSVEAVLPLTEESGKAQVQDPELEMTKNIAYGPVNIACSQDL